LDDDAPWRPGSKKTGGDNVDFAGHGRADGRGGAGSGALPSWRWPKPEFIWRPPTQLGRHTSTSMRSAGELTRTELGARNGVARAAERGTTIEESQAEAEARIPIGRANQPEDIAATAVFLASPAARKSPASLQRRRRAGAELASNSSCPQAVVTPAKAGARGSDRDLPLWVPAFAETANSDSSPGLGLAGVPSGGARNDGAKISPRRSRARDAPCRSVRGWRVS
jgi:hypothetical protein